MKAAVKWIIFVPTCVVLAPFVVLMLMLGCVSATMRWSYNKDMTWREAFDKFLDG